MKTRKFKILISVLFFLGLGLMVSGKAQAIDWELIAKFEKSYNSFKGQLESIQSYQGSLHSCFCFQPPPHPSDGAAHPEPGEVCNSVLKDQLEKDLLKAFEDSFSKVVKGGEFYRSFYQFTGDVQGVLSQNQYLCSDKMTALGDLQQIYNLTFFAYIVSPAGSEGPNPPIPQVPTEAPPVNPDPQPIQPNVVTADPVTSDPQPTSQEVNEPQGPGPQFVKFGSVMGGGCSMGTMTEGGANAWMLGLFLTLPLYARILRRNQQDR